MAKGTLYNYSSASPVQISRELYTSVGAATNILGDIRRAFKGGASDFEIWDSPAAGTQLTLDTDYTEEDADSALTTDAGYDVNSGYAITNASYQNTNIYITYKILMSYNDASTLNTLNTDVDNLQLTANSIIADYTITDTDIYGTILADPSSEAITVTLPTVADNNNRIIVVKVTTSGGAVTLTGSAGTVLVMHSIDDNCTVISDGTSWNILKAKQSIDTGWINRAD